MNIITEHPTPAAIEGQKLKRKPNIGKNWSAYFPFPSGACSKLIYWKDWWQHGDCGASPGWLCNALKWLGAIGHLCWSRLLVLQSGAAAGRGWWGSGAADRWPRSALPGLRAAETACCIRDDWNLIIYHIDFQLQLQGTACQDFEFIRKALHLLSEFFSPHIPVLRGKFYRVSTFSPPSGNKASKFPSIMRRSALSETEPIQS